MVGGNGVNHMPDQDSFITSNLDLAAYLTAVGQPLVAVRRQGKFLSFIFDPNAASDAEQFLAGASAPAREVLECYRELRTIITTQERQKKYASKQQS
jgi:hypothetical protein